MRTALLALLLAQPTWAQAPRPDACGGIALKEGVVNTARRLQVAARLPKGDLACATAVGRALKRRGGVRAVTVAVRLPDALRVGPLGEQVAAAYAKAVVAGGIPEARVSTVVPAAAHGEQNTLAITFTERRGNKPVGRIDAAQGKVTAGRSEPTMKPVRTGDTLAAQTLVGTGRSSTSWVALADGSRVKLLPETLLRLGRMYLDDDLKRVVNLDLRGGKIEAEVKSGGKGANFQITSGAAVAGVRGTRFRMAGGDDGTRIETLEGNVALTSEGETVEVKAGFAAKAEPGKAPSQPTALLAPPKVTGPLKGALAAGASLVWEGISGARSYRVEIARDAEFVFDARGVDAAATSLPVATLQLAKGKWFWRVRGVDGDDFGGRSSKVYAFDWGG